MSEKKYKWYKIDEYTLPRVEKEIKLIKTEKKTICVTLLDGEYYAFAHKCPHAGGELAEGFIDERNNITCPLHRYRFRVSNGFNCSGEGYYLSTYPVEQRNDGIYVGFAESSIWDIFK